MPGKTSIEWATDTWNPTTGCHKVSPGCKFCYAERIWPRVYGKHRRFTNVQTHPDRLDQPLRWKRPRMIFVNSMSDLFHDAISDEFIDEVFAVMGACEDQGRGHVFQVLTKRPYRMLKYMLERGHTAWNRRRLGSDAYPPRNVWLGVSVEDQARAYERIPLLLRTPAAIRWLSCEPLLQPIDLRWFLRHHVWDPVSLAPIAGRDYGHGTRVDWVVVGGESGRNKAKCRPMQAAWAVSIMEQCRDAWVPFFMKQGAQNNWPKFKDFNAFPPSLQVREYPELR